MTYQQALEKVESVSKACITSDAQLKLADIYRLID